MSEGEEALEWQLLSCKKIQHPSKGPLKLWHHHASQGLFKSPWILLNSPNFYNFGVAFATAMSTLLLGDCPYSCAVLRWRGGVAGWKLSLANVLHGWEALRVAAQVWLDPI